MWNHHWYLRCVAFSGAGEPASRHFGTAVPERGEASGDEGKFYDVVSFAFQQPDATVFLPSGSEAKAVGKNSRRVSLVRYPDSEELEKPGFGSRTPSSKKSAGSSRKTVSRFASASKNRSSQGSALSMGQRSTDPTQKHKQKRKDESSLGHSNVSGKSSEGYQSHGGDSNTTSEIPQTPVEKSKKKKPPASGLWRRFPSSPWAVALDDKDYGSSNLR
ncbi:hypothetical protein ABZP36_014657 [Zizania latifolia]